MAFWPESGLRGPPEWPALGVRVCLWVLSVLTVCMQGKPLCVFVCLSVCMSFCLFVCLSVCVFFVMCRYFRDPVIVVHKRICLSGCTFIVVCMSACPCAAACIQVHARLDEHTQLVQCVATARVLDASCICVHVCIMGMCLFLSRGDAFVMRGHFSICNPSFANWQAYVPASMDFQ
jgi:hypothetical protein